MCSRCAVRGCVGRGARVCGALRAGVLVWLRASRGGCGCAGVGAGAGVGSCFCLLFFLHFGIFGFLFLKFIFLKF